MAVPPGDGAPMLGLTLPAKAQSAKTARRFAADCTAGVDGDLHDVVELLVSELVTNAVIHGGPHLPDATVGLAVEALSHRIRVEVTDVGSGSPVVRHSEPSVSGGQGLALVQALASRWGCESSDTGKTVWFEIDVVPAEPGGPQ